MVRAIIAVVVSYIIMNILVMAMFLGATFALGIEGTLRSGEYWTSRTFNTIVLVGSVGIAFVSGSLCGLIARSWRPGVVVAGIMLVVGLGGAVMNNNKPDPPVRAPAGEGETSTEYAMKVLKELADVGKEPAWFAFSVPVLSAGVFLLGASVATRRGRSAKYATLAERSEV